jgi:chaperonin GroEL
MRSGFDTVADALSPTLGPTARTVLVEKMNRWETPEVIDDAATIARRIVELPLYRNAGGMLMRHAVWRVLDQVGDGTATAAVIAQALLRETTRYIADGANPAVMRKGIEDGLVRALEVLDTLALPVESLDALRCIALGACHDEAVAERIAEIHDKYGWGVTICLQEWLTNELAVEFADGWKWGEGGYASSEFITDQERGLVWSEQPFILFTNVFLEFAEQVVPIMQQVSNAGGKEIVFMSPKIADTALSTMLINNERGTIHSVGIRSPGVGLHQLGVAQDLAALTGGRFLEADAGLKPALATIEDLGYSDLVWASRDFFAVIGGDGEEEAVALQADSVRAVLELENPPYDRDQLRKRLGYLTGGVATLSVGAATKTEMAERIARAQRAVKAVESGRRDGVVPGGGVALFACAAAAECCDPALPLDERLGHAALARALEEPLRTIVANFGAEPEPIAHAVREGHGQVAFDAVKGELVDPVEAGILDPINVVRTALASAVSAGVMATLTEALVIPKYRYLHASPKP